AACPPPKLEGRSAAAPAVARSAPPWPRRCPRGPRRRREAPAGTCPSRQRVTCLLLFLDLDCELEDACALEHVEQVDHGAVRRILVGADDGLHFLAFGLRLAHRALQPGVVDLDAVE